MDPKRLVAQGYDQIAEQFLRQGGSEPSERKRAYLDRLTEGLPRGARVLDLGCGPGTQAGSLSERFRVVGVDISRAQLVLARQAAPRADLLLADMCTLAFRPASFDAISAFYSIIHVPKEEHGPLLRRLFEFLRPGGRLLAVLGAGEWEGTEDDWLGLGATMFWSHWDAETGLRLVQDAGFQVLTSKFEQDSLGPGGHQFVVAEKLR